MLLSEFLHADVVRTDLQAIDKWAAIEELVDVLVGAHDLPLSARESVLESVNAREKRMSTGMEHGIALPHASNDRVDDLVGALAVLPKGIEFESLDGLPARILLLMVMPQRNFLGHVSTLAGVAHLLKNGDFRKRLLGASDAAAILNLIESTEDEQVFHTKSNEAGE